MTYSRLDWDSDFFGLEIAEIDYVQINAIDLIDLQRFDLIYLRNCVSENFSIPEFELKFQETKVLFSKKIKIKNPHVIDLVTNTDETPLNSNILYPLAFESGKHSRFKLDQNFQKQKFIELYTKWIDNSIDKLFADKVIYIKKEQHVIGFVTVKIHEKYAKIGLIAVHPDSQGYGYGRILIQEAENYCIENDLFELQIPTQKENTSACHFYSKLGYSIIEQVNIKHLWKI